MIGKKFEGYLKDIRYLKANGGYLGEISLSEDELKKLFKYLSGMDRHHDRDINALLALAATNCAFYYYDEKGFWPHFDELIDDYYENHEYYGNLILNFFRKEGLLPSDYNDVGSGKYVRAILLQSGISKRHIPRYGDFIKYIIKDIGVNYALAISFIDFQLLTQKIPDSAKYLKNFLSKKPGWLYTRDVLGHLDGMLSQEDIYNAKGFHPNLWDYIFQEPDINKSSKTVKTYKKPFLSYNAEQRSMGIMFDPKGIHDHAYSMAGKTVRRSFLPFGEDMPVTNNISGLIYNPDVVEHIPWSINISPYLQRGFFLFHAVQPYQCAAITREVMPGDYYLILPREEPLLDSEALEALGARDEDELELLNEDYEPLEYIVYLIHLLPGSVIEEIGIRASSAETLKIEWAEGGKRLLGVVDNIYVWIGTPPHVKIIIPDSIRSRVIGYHDNGKEQSRLELTQKNSLAYPDVSPGSHGKIWLRPHGRVQVSEDTWNMLEKSYCVLPDCEIIWPDSLYSASDCPEIILRCGEDINIEWTYPDNVKIISNSGSELKWRLPAECTRVEGVMRYEGLEISIAFALSRCTMAPEIIWQEHLHERYNIELKALPHKPCTLLLHTDTANIELLRLKESNSGRYHLVSDDIIDSLNRINAPAGEFAIEVDGSDIGTQAYFLNADRMIDKIIEQDIDEKWLSLLPLNLQNAVNWVTDLRNEKYADINLEYSFASERLRKWFHKNIAASYLFDKHDLKNIPVEENDRKNEWLNFLDWGGQCKKLLSDESDYDVMQYEHIAKEGEQFIPMLESLKVERWDKHLKDWLSKLKLRSKITELISEWADQTRHLYDNEWNNEVVMMPAGKEMSRAWKAYSKGKFAEVCRRLNLPETKKAIEGANSVTAFLGNVVAVLALLRIGENSASASLIHNCSQRGELPFRESYKLLQEICMLCNGQVTSQKVEVKNFF